MTASQKLEPNLAMVGELLNQLNRTVRELGSPNPGSTALLKMLRVAIQHAITIFDQLNAGALSPEDAEEASVLDTATEILTRSLGVAHSDTFGALLALVETPADSPLVESREEPNPEVCATVSERLVRIGVRYERRDPSTTALGVDRSVAVVFSPSGEPADVVEAAVKTEPDWDALPSAIRDQLRETDFVSYGVFPGGVV